MNKFADYFSSHTVVTVINELKVIVRDMFSLYLNFEIVDPCLIMISMILGE